MAGRYTKEQVRANVLRMAAEGASSDEIDSYLSIVKPHITDLAPARSEETASPPGTTLDDLREEQPSLLDRIGARLKKSRDEAAEIQHRVQEIQGPDLTEHLDAVAADKAHHNVVTRGLAGAGSYLTRVVERPIETGHAVANAFVEPAGTVAEYLEQETPPTRRGRDALIRQENPAVRGPRPGEPPVTGVDATIAAAQLAALAIAHGEGELAERLVRGEAAPLSLRAYAGRIARHAVPGATIGAAYNREDPGAGAIALGTVGALSGLAARERVPIRNMAGEPERQLGTGAPPPRPPRPPTATATVETPPPAEVPPSEPESIIETLRRAQQEAASREADRGRSPITTEEPSSAPEPAPATEAKEAKAPRVVYRVSPIEADGARFSPEAPEPKAVPYDAGELSIADAHDPETAHALVEEEMQGEVLNEERWNELQTLAQEEHPRITHDLAPSFAAAAKRLGYDGVQPVADKADGPKPPLLIWNIRKVKRAQESGTLGNAAAQRGAAAPGGARKPGGVRREAAPAQAGGAPGGQEVPREAEAPRGPALETRPAIAGAEGHEGEVFFSNGEKLKTRYRVVDAADLQASHNPETFQPNRLYPENVQGRAYHGARGTAARQQVETETGKLRPEVLLDAGSGVTDGPPLVTHHGIVVAGNQRAMMLKRAASRAPEAYATYRAELEKRASQFGVSAEHMAQMKAPVLVRQIADENVDVNDPAALAELNRVSDQAPTKTKDQVSAAMSRAHAMNDADGALNHLGATMDPEMTVRDYTGTADGREFVRQLVKDGVISQQELPQFVDAATNTVHATGRQAIEDMLFAAAIGDADTFARAPADVLRKLGPSIPAIIAANHAGPYSLQPDLRGALDILSSAAAMRAEAGRGKRSVEDLLSQGDMFGRAIAQNAADLARFLEARSAGDISKAMRHYARLALEAMDQSQSADIFGEKPESPEQLRQRMFGAGGSGKVAQHMTRYAEEGEEAAPRAEKAESATKHEFSSTQLDLPDEIAAKIREFAAQIPEKDLAKDGREDKPHITIKYGLHADNADEVRALLANEKPITVTFGDATFFPNGESDSGDVLKIDVHSPALRALNRKIAAALPHTDTHPGYKPHATIAYLKPGLGGTYTGRTPLTGKSVTLHELTFSDKNGETATIPLGGQSGRVAEKDLFGYDEEQPTDQRALFGEKEGSESARNLEQTERASRNELDKLRAQLAAKPSPIEEARIARRMAELERLVNRDKKISAEEMRRRALEAKEPTASALKVAAQEGEPDLIVIPCGSVKRDVEGKLPAGNLYAGPYFLKALHYALEIAPPEKIRILSAKHGLLQLDDKIAPYEMRMKDKGAISVEQLRAQAEEQGLANLKDVRVLGGKEYLERAASVFPNAERVLPEGMEIGEQLSALKKMTEERRAENIKRAKETPWTPSPPKEPEQGRLLERGSSPYNPRHEEPDLGPHTVDKIPRNLSGLAAVKLADGRVFIGGDHAQALLHAHSHAGVPESAFWDKQRGDFRRDVVFGTVGRDGKFVSPRALGEGTADYDPARVDEKLAELKRRLAAGEEPKIKIKGPEHPDIANRTRAQLTESLVREPIDLAGMTYEEWWASKPFKERKQILNDMGFGSGWATSRDISRFVADHPVRHAVKSAFEDWQQQVGKLPGGGFVFEPRNEYTERRGGEHAERDEESGAGGESRGRAEAAHAADEVRRVAGVAHPRSGHGEAGEAPGGGALQRGAEAGGRSGARVSESDATRDALDPAELYRQEMAKRGLSMPKRTPRTPRPVPVEEIEPKNLRRPPEKEDLEEEPTFKRDYYEPDLQLERLQSSKAVDEDGNPLRLYYATASPTDNPYLNPERFDYNAPHLTRPVVEEKPPDPAHFGWDYEKARAAMLASGFWTEESLARRERFYSRQNWGPGGVGKRVLRPGMRGLDALRAELEYVKHRQLNHPGAKFWHDDKWWAQFAGLVQAPFTLNARFGLHVYPEEGPRFGAHSTKVTYHPVYLNIKNPLRLNYGGAEPWTYRALREAIIASGAYTEREVAAYERSAAETQRYRPTLFGIRALEGLLTKKAVNKGRRYDGFVWRTASGKDAWVAFKGEQIEPIGEILFGRRGRSPRDMERDREQETRLARLDAERKAAEEKHAEAQRAAAEKLYAERKAAEEKQQEEAHRKEHVGLVKHALATLAEKSTRLDAKRQFAEMVGVQARSVFRWVSGQYPVPSRAVEVARKVLGVETPNRVKESSAPYEGRSRFYSRLARAIDAAPFEKGTPDQWRAQLSKNVPKEEVEWTKIDKYLESEGPSITKTELKDLFQRNRIQLEESVARHASGSQVEINVAAQAAEEAERKHAQAVDRLGSVVGPSFKSLIDEADPEHRTDLSRNPESYFMTALRLLESGNEGAGDYLARLEGHATRHFPANERKVIKDLAGKVFETGQRLRQARDDLRVLSRGHGNTRWAQLTELGGENYREIKIQLGSRDAVARRELGKPYRQLSPDERRELFGDVESQAPDFESDHFDEPNILVHARVKDRTLPNGEKVLFVEEIQSDWHEQGREQGYASDLIKHLHVVEEPDAPEHRRFVVRHNVSGEGVGAGPTVNAAFRNAVGTHSGIPDAPFKRSEEWGKLALRRLIEEAVDGGYDRIGWTTGGQQTTRYPDLSKRVQWIKWSADENGTISIDAMPLESEGNPREMVQLGIKPEKLANAIGKELARQVKEQIADGETEGDFSGDDLKVGGHGLRAFYDELTPKFAKEVGKELGVKIEIEPVDMGISRTIEDDEFLSLTPTRAELEALSARHNDAAAVAAIRLLKQYPEGVALPAPRELRNAVASLRPRDRGALAEALGLQVSVNQQSIKITPELKKAVEEKGLRLMEPGKSYRGESLPKPRSVKEAQLDLFGEDGEHIRKGDPLAEDEEMQRGIAARAARFDADVVKYESKPLPGRAYKPTGRSLAVEVAVKMLREADAASLVGVTMGDLADYVAAAQVLRNPFYETLYVHLTKGGKIVGSMAISSRVAGSALMFRGTPEYDLWDYINDRAEELGADGYGFTHNHPTGKVDPSSDDRRANSVTTANVRRVRRERGKMPLKYHGHVVINHESYAVIDEDGHVSLVHKVLNPSTPDPFRSGGAGTLPHPTVGREIVNADHLIAAALEVGPAEGNAHVLWQNAQGNVQELGVLSVGWLKKKSVEQAQRAIADHGATMAGAVGAFLVAQDTPAMRQALRPLVEAGVFRDVAFTAPDGRVVATARYDLGWSGDPTSSDFGTGDDERAQFGRVAESGEREYAPREGGEDEETGREGRAHAPAETREAGRRAPAVRSEAQTAAREGKAGRVAEPPPEYGRGGEKDEREPVGSMADYDDVPTPKPTGFGAASRVRPGVVRHAILSLFNPELLGRASKGVAGTIRAETAHALRELEIAREALRKLGHVVGQLDRKESVRLWDMAEHGEGTGDAFIDEGNRTLRRVTEKRTEQLLRFDRLQAEAAIENYLGRFWTVPEGRTVQDFLRVIMGKRPFEGPKSFLKHRTWESFVDGLKAIGAAQKRLDADAYPNDDRGEADRKRDEWLSRVRPVTYNYVDSQLAKLAEMDRLIAAERMKRYEKAQGRAKGVLDSDEPPVTLDGRKWVLIDPSGQDPAFNMYGPREGMVALPEEAKEAGIKPEEVHVFGIRKIGRWYAHPDAAPVWHAHLSQGIRAHPLFGPLFQAYMAPANASVQIILGFSGFHFMNIAREGINSRLALSLDDLANKGGDLTRAARHLGMAPAAVALDAAFGRRIMEEYRKPGTHPELERVLRAMIEGGFRGQAASEFWTGDRVEALRKAWREAFDAESTKFERVKGLAKIGPDVLWAGIESQMKPLMQYYVPWMKTAATYRAVAQALAKMPPNTSLDVLRAKIGDIVKEMDYRYGHVVYDNHFMNRVIKDLAQAIFLAPGWTFGWLTLGGRAMRDVAVLPKRIVDRVRHRGGRRGAAEEEAAREMLGPSAAVIAAGLVFYMIVNGLITYFHTGEQPHGKDYFAYRDGTLDRDGNANRHVLPGAEMRDFYAWGTHPVRTAAHKMKPALSFIYRWLTNSTYFGDLVYDPDASMADKVKQVAKEAGRELGTPLSYQNWREAEQRGGEHPLGEAARTSLGITPAKREFQRTPAQNKLYEFSARHGHTALTPDQQESSEFRRELSKDLREARTAGDSAEVQSLIQQAREAKRAGDLSRRQAQNIIRTTRKARLALMFRGLSYEEGLKVYELANPEERALWYPLLHRKAQNTGHGREFRALNLPKPAANQ